MARSFTRALALLALEPAAAAFQEASVLVQQAAQLHGRQEPQAHVCTEEEYKAYDNVHNEYMLKVKTAKSKQQGAKEAKFNATMERVGSTFAELTAPLLTVPEQHMKLVREAIQPLLKDVVQFVTEKFGKPQKGAYSDSDLQFNLEKEIADFRSRLDSMMPQEETSIRGALSQFNDLVDARAREKFPGLVDQLPRLSMEPAAKVEQLVQYLGIFVTAKAAPVMLSEAFPEVAKVLPVLLSRPTNINDVDFWVKNIALPALPEACRNATELLDSAAIAKSKDGTDLFDRFKSFVSTLQSCTAVLIPQPAEVEMEALPEEPKLPCLTCSQYGKMQIAVRCTGLCGHVLSNCMSSRNNDCMHGAASCLDCVEAHAQPEQCEFAEPDAKLIKKLGEFRTAMKQGSLEEDGLSALTDAVSDVMLSATA